jgi:hypothetical protein
MATFVRLLFLLLTLPALAQTDFVFDDARPRKVSLKFQLINNLIVIPVTVNGVELNFLLDSGVDETILFSLDDREVSFNNVQSLKLKGLGSQEPIEGLKSSGNILRIADKLTDRHHDVYIVLDPSFNVSASLGIEVNGIMGYHVFAEHQVEINYGSRRITFHPDPVKTRKKLERNFHSLPITVENHKPYLVASSEIDGRKMASKVLVDTGNADAIWIFESDTVKVPTPNFEDYLGRGFSGDIHGKRARIGKFGLGDVHFENPIVAFPDSISIRNLQKVSGRVGSVGGEILRRFTVVLDYDGKRIYLRPNSHRDDPFHYNMSGIEVHHVGVTWVRETVQMQHVYMDASYDVDGNKQREFTYKVELKPVYAVSNVRPDSPAALAGVEKNDEIVSINGRPGHQYSLQQIINLMKSESGRTITMEVKRNGQTKKLSFTLKAML